MFKVNIDMPDNCLSCPFHIFDMVPEYKLGDHIYRRYVRCKLQQFMLNAAFIRYKEINPYSDELDFDNEWNPILSIEEADKKRMPDCLLIECNEEEK